MITSVCPVFEKPLSVIYYAVKMRIVAGKELRYKNMKTSSK